MKNVVGGLNGCGCKDECATYDDCPGNQVCDTIGCMGGGPGCTWSVCAGKI